MPPNQSADSHANPSDVSSSDRRPVYQLYGLALASDFPFQSPLPAGRAAPDLHFSCTDESPFPGFWDEADKLFATAQRTPGGAPHTELFRGDDRDVLRFGEAADFYVGRRRIACHLRDASYDFGVEIWLLGTVLPYWLEQQGTPALHGAAAVLEGRAVAFLGANGSGKTSLALALTQAGGALLTDNILPIRIEDGDVWAEPGYPQLRLWPDQAERFYGNAEALPRVVPHLEKRYVPLEEGKLGPFHDSSAPLARIYLPDRHDEEATDERLTLEPVEPRRAVGELSRHSAFPALADAAGWQQQRLMTLIHLVRRVPVRRLRYPSGLEHLPAVCRALSDDLHAA